MEKILVGSRALQGRLLGFNRIPSDTDYIINEDLEIKEKNKTNTEYIYCPLFFEREDFHSEGVATLKGMLNLKYSHLRRDLSWDKHMYDFQLLYKELGEDQLDVEYCNKMLEFWDTKYPIKMRRSNLASSKSDFFNNAINEDVDQHDFLHTLINPTPAYTQLLKDGCDVELDESKWHNQTDEFKWSVIIEETIVMAAERYGKRDNSVRQAFCFQLKDNIKKHFPSYIAHYAIINYPTLVSKPSDYVVESYEKLKTHLYG